MLLLATSALKKGNKISSVSVSFEPIGAFSAESLMNLFGFCVSLTALVWFHVFCFMSHLILSSSLLPTILPCFFLDEPLYFSYASLLILVCEMIYFFVDIFTKSEKIKDDVDRPGADSTNNGAL